MTPCAKPCRQTLEARTVHFPLEPPERTQPYPYLDFSPVKPISDFWPQEGDNIFFKSISLWYFVTAAIENEYTHQESKNINNCALKKNGKGSSIKWKEVFILLVGRSLFILKSWYFPFSIFLNFLVSFCITFIKGKKISFCFLPERSYSTFQDKVKCCPHPHPHPRKPLRHLILGQGQNLCFHDLSTATGF